MNAYTQTPRYLYEDESDQVLQPLIVKMEKLEEEWKLQKSKHDEKLKANDKESAAAKPFKLIWNKDAEKVEFGPNRTELSKKMYLRVNFSSYHDATRDLCLILFGREVLATHTVTGKYGPGTVCNNAKAKGKLNPVVVEDIVHHVKAIFNVSERQILYDIRLACRNSARILNRKEKRGQ